MDTFIITAETEEAPDSFKAYSYDNIDTAIKVYWKMKSAGRHPEVYVKLDLSGTDPDLVDHL